jgi:hypothetical protein
LPRRINRFLARGEEQPVTHGKLGSRNEGISADDEEGMFTGADDLV